MRGLLEHRHRILLHHCRFLHLVGPTWTLKFDPFQQHPTLRQIYDKEVGTGGMTRQQFWTAFLEFSVTSSKQHDNLKFNDATKYNKFDNFEEKDKEEAKRRFKEACTENADTFAVSSDALDIYHGIYENRCSQGAYDLTFAMLFMFHLLQYHKPKF
jgi:hypothetical protein